MEGKLYFLILLLHLSKVEKVRISERREWDEGNLEVYEVNSVSLFVVSLNVGVVSFVPRF